VGRFRWRAGERVRGRKGEREKGRKGEREKPCRLVTWLCRVTQNADGSADENALAAAKPPR